MSCTNTSCSVSSKTISIVQGQNVTFTVQLIDKETCDPFSLAGFTGATGYFPKEDDTALAVTGSLVSSDLGKISFALQPADTDLIKAGDELDFEIEADTGDKIIAQILGKLSVTERLF